MGKFTTGDAMKIAVMVQDMTSQGLNRIEQNLRKIPANIRIQTTMDKFNAIQKLTGDISKAAGKVKELNTLFNGLGGKKGLGQDALKGLIADAQRFERNLLRLQDSLSKITSVNGKVDARGLLSQFGGMKRNDQKDWASLVRGMVASAQTELNKLNKKTPTIDANDTKAVRAHEQAIKRASEELQRYTTIQERMQRIMSRQDKAAIAEANRLYNQQQQSLRIVDSSQARNRGAYQKADFDDYLRRFRIMSSSQRLDEIEAKKSARDRAKTNLNYEQYKLERIDPSNTQAVAKQAQVVAQLRAEYNALNSELKRLRTTQEQLNKAEKKADTKAQQQRLRAERQEAKRAQQEQKKALQESKQSATQYRAELNNVQVAMRNTSTFASQLREDITQAFGYYALKQFLGNLIEIGGQFEYQRRAIANILQDGTKANTLFNQIKELGVKSPFSTLDLDKYAKQLSAFDIPYHRMYETLKKIADISAGTGADMSRIILAYGHVKAEGFLTGVQRRQFSNANINMVGGLADYYSKLEGQKVSKADVYQRIHDKQVSFEDMDRVLMSMAEEGGQFFQMQEVMADTVKGTYKNLSDALNHAYMAMEKSANGPLMAVGKGLTFLLQSVEKFPGAATRFIAIASSMAIIRATIAKATDQEAAASVRKAIALDREQRAMGLVKSKALGGAFSFGAGMTTTNANRLGALAQKDAGVRNAVMQAIATRKLNIETAKQIQLAGGFTKKQLEIAIAQRALWPTIVRGATAAGAAVKGFLVSMWPMAAITIIIEGIAWAWNKFNDTEGEERKKAMVDALKDSYNSLLREMEDITDISFDNLYTSEVFEEMKKMTDIVKNNLADSEVILGRVYEKDANGGYLYTTLEQAKKIREELEEAKLAREFLSNEDNAILYAEAETDGFKDKYKDYKTSRGDVFKYFKDEQTALKYTSLVGNFLRSEEGGKYSHLIKDVNPENKIGFIRAITNDNEALGDFLTWAKGTDTNDVYKRTRAYNILGDVSHSALNKMMAILKSSKALSEYASTQTDTWSVVAKNQGKDPYSMVMGALGATTLDPEGQKFVADLIARTEFPEEYKGKHDGNVQAPNAIVDAINKKMQENKDVNQRLRSFQINRTFSIPQMLEAFQKDYKQLKENFDAFKNNDKISWDGKTFEKLKKTGDAKTDQVIEDFNKDIERRNNLLDAARIAGWDEADLKEKKKSGTGYKKDEWLEKERLWFDTIKRASKLYKDNAKVFGTAEAFRVVSEMPEFKDILAGMDEETLASLSGTLKARRETHRAEYNATDDRKKLANQIAQYEGELDLDDLKDKVQRNMNEVSKYMSDQLQKYDIYTKMYNATGSQSIASLFAFGSNGPRQQYDEFVKSQFNQQMQQKGYDYTFDQLAGWDEYQWKKHGEEVRKVFKDAENNIKSWKKTNKEAYAELLKGNKSFEQAMTNIKTAYNKEVEVIQNQEGLSPDEKYNHILGASYKKRLDELDLEWGKTNFKDFFTSYGYGEVYSSTALKRGALEKSYKYGKINTQQYLSGLDEVDKIEREYAKANALPFVSSTTQAFLTGGIMGYKDRVKQNWRAAQLKAAEDESYKETDEYKNAESQNKKVINWEKIEDAVGAFTDTLLESGKTIKSVTDLLSNMFDALGMEDSANAMGDISSAIGGAMSGASALSALGPYGIAAGAVIGGITAIAQTHDKQINRSIEKSKQNLKDLQFEYQDIERQIKRSNTNDSAGYNKNYQNLIDQRKELQNQLSLEQSKKKQDQDSIRELNSQIAELTDQIQYYFSDLLKELYGLDFKDYGKRLSDSLVSAFRNGENAAIAWQKTVGEIVRELSNELISQKFIMPLMDQLFEEAFGVGGRLSNKTTISEDDVKWLGDRLGSLGTEVIPQAEALYKAMELAFPYSEDSESVGGLTRLGEQLTEETGTVLAGYINSIRADVSHNRKCFNEVVTRAIPALEDMNVITKSQLAQLRTIEENTRANAEAAKSILSVLNDVTNGNKSLYING